MKSYYLQAMGIVEWKLRDTVHYYLIDGPVSKGVLIVKLYHDKKQEQINLLEAILVALKVPVQPLQNLKGLNEVVSISLGNLQATTSTFSLKEMLHDNRLKASVWRSLQDFMKKL